MDSGEADPLNADTDADTVLDGHDNCLFAADATQRDTDGDGYSYSNLCDPDLNNDGGVNFADLAILKSLFFGPPEPSGVVP